MIALIQALLPTSCNKNDNSVIPLNFPNNIADSKGFRIANLNINSLLKDIDENPFDVLAINESKIDESFSGNEIKIPGHVSCRRMLCCFSGTASHFECVMN